MLVPAPTSKNPRLRRRSSPSFPPMSSPPPNPKKFCVATPADGSWLLGRPLPIREAAPGWALTENAIAVGSGGSGVGRVATDWKGWFGVGWEDG